MQTSADILGSAGAIARRLPNYELRQQQLDMADAVADAIANQHHLLVEAGTGVGKSFAYLVPAILAATAERGPEEKPKRIIVSTHTIALQEQLIQKDLPLLSEFLALLPPRTIAAFEFRHESWLADEVFDALRGRNIALCIADTETRETPLVMTASYAYLRLRDEGYAETDIARWAETTHELSRQCSDVFVYFKHEDEGKGAAFGQQMMRLLQNT